MSSQPVPQAGSSTLSGSWVSVNIIENQSQLLTYLMKSIFQALDLSLLTCRRGLCFGRCHCRRLPGSRDCRLRRPEQKEAKRCPDSAATAAAAATDRGRGVQHDWCDIKIASRPLTSRRPLR